MPEASQYSSDTLEIREVHGRALIEIRAFSFFPRRSNF